MTANVKDFYLNTEMEKFEYMQMPLQIMPPEITQQYKLNDIAHNSTVYIEICKGMYGLPQAGKLANKKLTHHLAKHRYIPSTITPGLWHHTSCPIQLSL